jgi:hypothetical protein
MMHKEPLLKKNPKNVNILTIGKKWGEFTRFSPLFR